MNRTIQYISNEYGCATGAVAVSVAQLPLHRLGGAALVAAWRRGGVAARCRGS